MTSRPLRIAFTALTLSLAVSLSLWVFHASHEQRELSQAVTLRMPSAPARINSHEVRENLKASRPAAEPFAATGPQPPMVELDEPPELIGIEAAPVSQNSSVDRAPPPFPSGDEIENLPELSLDVPPQDSQTVDEPLELPELTLGDPADLPVAALPQLDPIGPEPEIVEPPESPIVELMIEPLAAPRPPAWLSVQATLEAEIEELRQQQTALQAALADSRRAAADWKQQERTWRQRQQIWNDERRGMREQLTVAQKDVVESSERLAESNRQVAAFQELLESSKREAVRLRQQREQLNALLDESQAVNAELKHTLKEKMTLISRLENDVRKAQHEIEELRSKRAVRGIPQHNTPNQSTHGAAPADSGAPALLPPLPNGIDNTAPSDVVPAEPIVPRLAGRPDPPVAAEQPMYSYARRAPLIPADVCVNQGGRCARCGRCLDSRPRKKQCLVYDLKDWFHEWRDGNDCCRVCEPVCTDTGLCTQTACGGEKIGLIPDLVRWWKHRREPCHCGCY